ncbi:MAG: hypothetical protein ACLFVU_04335 [Phycisphaerae bacterium]
MDVRMEYTEGFGKKAEVWVGGDLLTVCDNISPKGTRTPPGPLEDVAFSYVTHEAFTWEEAVKANPMHKRLIEPVRDWSYVGFGRILQVQPVLIDFGILQMEDSNWTTDEDLVGAYVGVNLDRLEIHPAKELDWPEHMR